MKKIAKEKRFLTIIFEARNPFYCYYDCYMWVFLLPFDFNRKLKQNHKSQIKEKIHAILVVFNNKARSDEKQPTFYILFKKSVDQTKRVHKITEFCTAMSYGN